MPCIDNATCKITEELRLPTAFQYYNVTINGCNVTINGWNAFRSRQAFCSPQPSLS